MNLYQQQIAKRDMFLRRARDMKNAITNISATGRPTIVQQRALTQYVKTARAYNRAALASRRHG